jgi:acetylornithine/succinyldiaminopimelate/putrescine aminotransferase
LDMDWTVTWNRRECVACWQGRMQWLWDQEGKRYLDMFAGIVTVSVGHCHPRVTAALQKQIHRYSLRSRLICKTTGASPRVTAVCSIEKHM